ncbi:TetR/AcrR family transcriptional regulator [Rhodococcus sp. HM1]|uniref:TetR/AcrR family transcriptional regulator n=1 Tax=Rhodococcus sp. HM1 TaxID=2937759 RepID=UPI00200B9EE8|nr:TetR/AcrR family transcriptional regulator [Rhodococcus sp. HM1]MCK8674156.1 TetR/AcrR family transcriptional regulator [Rhodococcus sp. HM1]
MPSPRRIGAPDAKNRTVLLDAAEKVMLEYGYAAVSSRRVAEQAGLKPQLVHYYFVNMDELLEEVFRRRADQGLDMQRKALASPQPLWALWRFSSDPSGVALTMEFMAMSRHRPALRKLLADYSERFRRDQADAIEVLLDRYGVAHEDFPPVVASVLTTSLSRVVVMEESLGFTLGHAETIERVERWLTAVEGEWGSPKR